MSQTNTVLNHPSQNNTRLKIAVLVSGSGSNLQVLIDAMTSGELPVDIVGVISNREDAYAIERAKAANINVAVLSHVPSGKRMGIATFEKHALQQLNDWQPDIIVLAGFMRVLSGDFINSCPAPMINLHPSLLPKYKGLDTHARAIKAGDTQHGCSVHLVTAELDAGQVIAQGVLAINNDDTAESLQQRVHKLEHKVLPWSIYLIAQGVFKHEADLLALNKIANCKHLPTLPWQLNLNT